MNYVDPPFCLNYTLSISKQEVNRGHWNFSSLAQWITLANTRGNSTANTLGTTRSVLTLVVVCILVYVAGTIVHQIECVPYPYLEVFNRVSTGSDSL